MSAISKNFKESKERTANQKDKILKMLQNAGEHGVPNSKLIEVALRFSAVLHLLRRDGHIIELVSKGEGHYNYVLTGFQKPVATIPALEVLWNEVAEHDTVTFDELKKIMESKNLTFKRKAIR